jgi:hypothetical protein
LDACSIALEGLVYFKAGTVPVSAGRKKINEISDEKLSSPRDPAGRIGQRLFIGAIARTIFVQCTRMARK